MIPIRHLQTIIAQAFLDERLGVHVAGAVQGPHTVSLIVQLAEPIKANVARALSLSRAIEARLGDSPVRIYQESGRLIVQIPSPEPLIVDARRLLIPHPARRPVLAVPIGLTPLGAVAGVDLYDLPHWCIVGATNAGKTVTVRTLLYQLARYNRPSHVQFIVLSFKPSVGTEGWTQLLQLRHTLAVVSDPREMRSVVAWASAAIERRLRKQEGPPGQHTIIVLDDYLSLATIIPEVIGPLRSAVALGRSAGVHLIVSTQGLGKTVGLDAVTLRNMGRIAFGAIGAGDAALLSGQGGSGLEKLGRYPGDALLIAAGERIQRLAIGYLPPEALLDLAVPSPVGAVHEPPTPPPPRPWVGVGVGVPAPLTPPSTALTPTSPTASTTSMPSTASPHGRRGARIAARYDPETIRRLYARLGNKSQVAEQLFGYADSGTLAAINAALSQFQGGSP